MGVPDRTPPDDSVSPEGSAPEVMVKLMGAVPEAANVYPAYATPTVPVVGGVKAVNVTAVGARIGVAWAVPNELSTAATARPRVTSRRVIRLVTTGT